MSNGERSNVIRSAAFGQATARYPATSMSTGAWLREIVASRSLAIPSDLASEIGNDGASTRWNLNPAQTLVVASTAREAAIDDAEAYGRIAASAALAPIHAAAAVPLFARLICECPPGASDAARKHLLEGAAIAMSEAGAVLADAQFVDAPVLRFDMLVAGVVRPDRLRGSDGAQPGDTLILAGPLGAGVYAAAHARDKLSDADRQVFIAQATRSTKVGIEFGAIRNVHAVAVVGALGLTAAALSLTQSAAVDVRLRAGALPALPRALALAGSGCVSPQSSRNWNRDGALVRLDDTVMPEMRALLTDPQASGALLVSVKPESVERVLALCREDGTTAAIVGTVVPGEAGARARLVATA